MKKLKELPPTKTYNEGSIHELTKGEMKILKRWLGKDGYVMLQYEYTETGEREENREVNVVSNLAKVRRKKEFEKATAKASDSALNALREEVKELRECIKLLTIQQANLMEKIVELSNKK